MNVRCQCLNICTPKCPSYYRNYVERPMNCEKCKEELIKAENFSYCPACKRTYEHNFIYAYCDKCNERLVIGENYNYCPVCYRVYNINYKGTKEMSKLPKQIYVQISKYESLVGNSEIDLVACDNKEDALDADLGEATAGEDVGIYELKKVVKLKESRNITEYEA